MKDIVLVHGGFVDGSGSQGVYNTLKKNGYAVTIVENLTFSLADDVTVTKRALANQNGPVVLVGHSYGGRPYDTARCSTCHVETCRFDRSRGQRQPRRICVAATGCRFSHQKAAKGSAA